MARSGAASFAVVAGSEQGVCVIPFATEKRYLVNGRGHGFGPIATNICNGKREIVTFAAT